MLDRDGFRPNVGIILLNQKNQVFWGKRIRTHSTYRCWPEPETGCAMRCLTGLSAAMRAVITKARNKSGSCCNWLVTTGT